MLENLLSCVRYANGRVWHVYSKHDHRSARKTTSLAASPYMYFATFDQLSHSW